MRFPWAIMTGVLWMVPMHGLCSVCWPCWADAVAQIESGNNPRAIGDRGRARGPHQMHRPAWTDARTVDPGIGDWRRNAHNPVMSTRACIAYGQWLQRRLMQHSLTPSDLYTAYRAGPLNLKNQKNQNQHENQRFTNLYHALHRQRHAHARFHR